MSVGKAVAMGPLSPRFRSACVSMPGIFRSRFRLGCKSIAAQQGARWSREIVSLCKRRTCRRPIPVMCTYKPLGIAVGAGSTAACIAASCRSPACLMLMQLF